jgi:hypothetical protein
MVNVNAPLLFKIVVNGDTIENPLKAQIGP